MIRRLETHLGHLDTGTNDMAGEVPTRPHSASMQKSSLFDSGSKLGLHNDATVSSHALSLALANSILLMLAIKNPLRLHPRDVDACMSLQTPEETSDGVRRSFRAVSGA